MSWFLCSPRLQAKPQLNFNLDAKNNVHQRFVQKAMRKCSFCRHYASSVCISTGLYAERISFPKYTKDGSEYYRACDDFEPWKSNCARRWEYLHNWKYTIAFDSNKCLWAWNTATLNFWYGGFVAAWLSFFSVAGYLFEVNWRLAITFGLESQPLRSLGRSIFGTYNLRCIYLNMQIMLNK